MNFRRFALRVAIMLTATGSAHAQDAMIESASGGAPVAAFTFLSAGETFALSSTQRARIGYLKSCITEEITGGTVVIGAEQSRVTGGSVHRETLPCTTDVALSQAERNESGASAWRNDVSGDVVVIDNLAPILVFATPPSMLKIERTDIPARAIRLSGNSKTIDLAARGVTLEAGGIYIMTADNRRREIEVTFEAQGTTGPAFLRALRF